MSASGSIAVAPHRRPADGRDRHLRVVPAHRPRHRLRYILLAIVLTGAAVFGAVSLNALAAGDAVRAHDLEAQVVEAERTYDQLVAEVARLEDPGRIRAEAVELGMVPARNPRYLTPDRALSSDGATVQPVQGGETTDPLKPVLSVQR